MCVDMCVDMCLDICVDMCVDMHVDICAPHCWHCISAATQGEVGCCLHSLPYELVKPMCY